jgi:hypothetical protein
LREDRFRGTLPPSRRASLNPIAIACLRLVTFFPERPDLSFPLFISRIARSTFFPDFLPYFRVDFLRPLPFLRPVLFFRVLFLREWDLVLFFVRLELLLFFLREGERELVLRARFLRECELELLLLFFLRAATKLDPCASTGQEVDDNQHDDDDDDDVNQAAADVHEEPDQPQEEQYYDDRPEYASHKVSFQEPSFPNSRQAKPSS